MLYKSKQLLAGLLLALVLITRFTFDPLVPGAFLSDDIPNIYGLTQAAQVGQLFQTAITKFSTSFSIGGYFYRPMIAVFHAFDYTLSGSDPFGWHLTNILLHLLCMVLLVLVVRQLNPAAPDIIRDLTAVVSGVVFAFRPLVVEAVGWVSSRGDLLALAGMLLTVFAYHRANGRWNRWYFAAIGAFLFALASKEPAATVVGALVWLHIAQWVSYGVTRQDIKRSLQALLPFVLILTLYFGLRQVLFGTPFTVYLDTPPVELNNPEWWAARLRSLHYFLAPMRATLDEEHVGESTLLFFFTVAPVAVGAGLALFYRTVRHVWVIGAMWLVSVLVPSLPSLFLSTIEGERLLYIPTAPLAVLVVSPLFVLGSVQPSSHLRTLAQRTIGGVAAIGLVGLLWISFPLLEQRLREWEAVEFSMYRLGVVLESESQEIPAGQKRVLIVPDNIEGILFARNGQGALVLPPFQEEDVADTVLLYAPMDTCALPTDLPVTVYDYRCWDVSLGQFRPLDPATFNEDEWDEAWELED